MNKLGVVHSGYKPIIPIGNRICLRFQIDDWQKGKFWDRKMADHDPWTKYVYLYKRTYYEQLYKSIKEKPEEIFFVLDTLTHDLHDVQNMIYDIVQVTRTLMYRKNIIISVINEPLERWTQKEIHYNNSVVSKEILKYPGVYFAVGEMACDFEDYYRSYLNVNYKYDYISFHTDNNCEFNNLKKFVNIFTSKTKFINNEHYYYNGSQKYNYDDIKVIEKFKTYTLNLLAFDRIKSIYICMPFHYAYLGKYDFLGLNLVDLKNDTVVSTKAWQMLKQYDIKAVIKMYLKELRNGDKDFQVRALQGSLNKSLDVKLKVDGNFGKITEAEVVKFNTKNNIFPLVICSYATWYELLQDLQTEIIVKDLIDLIKVIE